MWNHSLDADLTTVILGRLMNFSMSFLKEAHEAAEAQDGFSQHNPGGASNTQGNVSSHTSSSIFVRFEQVNNGKILF
jgi:hypothetical protein